MVYLGKVVDNVLFFRALSDLHSSVFNDFGPKFTVVDPTGEEPLTGMIVSVEKVYDPHSGFKIGALIDSHRTRRVL